MIRGGQLTLDRDPVVDRPLPSTRPGCVRLDAFAAASRRHGWAAHVLNRYSLARPPEVRVQTGATVVAVTWGGAPEGYLLHRAGQGQERLDWDVDRAARHMAAFPADAPGAGSTVVRAAGRSARSRAAVAPRVEGDRPTRSRTEGDAHA